MRRNRMGKGLTLGKRNASVVDHTSHKGPVVLAAVAVAEAAIAPAAVSAAAVGAAVAPGAATVPVVAAGAFLDNQGGLSSRGEGIKKGSIGRDSAEAPGGGGVAKPLSLNVFSKFPGAGSKSC